MDKPKEELLAKINDLETRINDLTQASIEHKQLLLLFDMIDEPIYVADSDTHEILYANNAIKKILGAVEGRLCYQAFHNNSVPCSFCTNQFILGQNMGKTYVWEFQDNRNDQWYRCIDRAMKWEDGRIVRFEIAFNISQYKQMETRMKEVERRFMEITEQAREWMWETDAEGRYTYSTPGVQSMTGYSHEELLQRYFYDFFHPVDLERQKKEVIEIFDRKEAFFEYVHRNIHKNGCEVWLSTTGVPILDNFGKLLGYRGSDTDITEWMHTEEMMRRTLEKIEELHEIAREMHACESSEEVYRKTVETAEKILDFSMCILDIVDNEKLVTVAISSKYPVINQKEFDLNAGYAGKTYRTGNTYLIRNIDTEPGVNPARSDFKSGISAPIGKLGVFQIVSNEVDAFDEQDVRLIELLLGHTNEALKRIKLQEDLKQQVVKDPLTGMFNRYYLTHFLEKEISRSERYNHPMAFLMVDIDRFKEINDIYGHRTGDEILQIVAFLLTKAVRSCDTVIRYGGDEFLILLPETDHSVDTVQNRIYAQVSHFNNTDNVIGFPITLSIGSAFWLPTGDKTVEEIIIEADKKMYENKRRRRNNFKRLKEFE